MSATLLAIIALFWPVLDTVWNWLSNPRDVEYNSRAYWLLEQFVGLTKAGAGFAILFLAGSAHFLAVLTLVYLVVSWLWLACGDPAKLTLNKPDGRFYGLVAFVAASASIVASISILT